MEFALALAGISAAHLLAVMSPGPSFLVVARMAAAHSRGAGLFAALGMAVGALTWATLAALGLGVLFAHFDWLYLAMRVMGGAYLVYIAIAIWRGAAQPLPDVVAAAGAVRHVHAFRHALLTQLSNPKVLVFFGSIFVALLPADAPVWMIAAALAIVFVQDFAWYGLVAVSFSLAGARRLYGRAKLWLDRVTAGFLGLLGVKLVLDGR